MAKAPPRGRPAYCQGLPTKGRIIVREKLVSRGKGKRADYNILYFKPNIPIAIVEARDNNHSIGDGLQKALEYAATLGIPFVFSSNEDGFVFHDRTGTPPRNDAKRKQLVRCPCYHRLFARSPLRLAINASKLLSPLSMRLRTCSREI